jgi:hypothetical protein
MTDRLLKQGANLSGQFGRLALALAFSLVLALDASAETVAQTASKWGLIGSWALDCSLPPDRGKGALLAYEVAPGGRVMHRRNFGDVKDENQVLSAKVSGNGMLNLRVSFPGLKETREYGMMKQPDGTMRAMYNRNAKEEYSIKDGNFTSNGNPSPAQHKCK